MFKEKRAMKSLSILAVVAALSVSVACTGNCSDAGEAPATADSLWEKRAKPEVRKAVQNARQITARFDQALAGGNADPVKVREALASVKGEVKKLKQEANPEVALAYVSVMKQYLKEHAEELEQITPESAEVLAMAEAAETALKGLATLRKAAHAVSGGDSTLVERIDSQTRTTMEKGFSRLSEKLKRRME